MALSTTETVGFLEQLVQLMESNKTTLSAGGLDVTNWITDTDEQKDLAVTKDGEKNALKALRKRRRRNRGMLIVRLIK